MNYPVLRNRADFRPFPMGADDLRIAHRIDSAQLFADSEISPAMDSEYALLLVRAMADDLDEIGYNPFDRELS